jgi:hypothetical protein
MKKYFGFLGLALLLSFVVESYAQSRVFKTLNFAYENKNTNRNRNTSPDSLSAAQVDTVVIGLSQGEDGLAPIGVTVAIKITDADISATPDSIKVRYETGIGDIFKPHIGTTTFDSVNAIASGSKPSPIYRTFVFSTDGENNAEFNTNVSIIPHCTDLMLIFSQVSADTDTLGYQIQAKGIYQKQ